MKNKITLINVVNSIQSSKRTVSAYMDSKCLPKWVGNAMLKQLDNAVTKVSENDLNLAYCYLLAYYKIRDEFGEGRFTKHGDVPLSVKRNPYFYNELSVNQAFTFMTILGLKPNPDYKHKAYVRLLDCMRHYEVKVDYCGIKDLADEIKDKAKIPTWEEFTS